MLSLLRAVSRSALYREHVKRLSSRAPDDIWYVQGRWIITFALSGTDVGEEVLLFALDEPGTRSAPVMRAASRVMRDPAGRVSVAPSVRESG